MLLSARIEADIAAGITVIIDRYYYSGIVYSAAKLNPTLSLQWARKPDEGLPRPDICIFLDISPQEAAARGGFGGEKYEKKEMQDRVRTLFSQLRSSPDGAQFNIVDGGERLDQVSDMVLKIAQQTIRHVESTKTPLQHIVAWSQESEASFKP